MATQKSLRSGKDFLQKFDPHDYSKRYYSTFDADDPSFLHFNSKTLFEVYYKGNIKGEKLLDIGSGPCLNSVIPAVKWFDEIFLSDYSQVNRKVLNEWMANDLHDEYWQSFFIHFSQSNENGIKWHHWKNELKTKIAGVLSCDVNFENPLYPIQNFQADVVSSSLCLDSACVDLASYQNAMRNMVSLVKPRGKFVIAGVLNSQSYIVGSERFSSLTLKKSDVLETIKMAGLHVLACFSELEDTKKKSGIVVIAEKI